MRLGDGYTELGIPSRSLACMTHLMQMCVQESCEQISLICGDSSRCAIASECIPIADSCRDQCEMSSTIDTAE